MTGEVGTEAEPEKRRNKRVPSGGTGNGQADGGTTQTERLLARFPAGPACSVILAAEQRVLLALNHGNRHRAMLGPLLALLRKGQQGHPGVGQVVAELRKAFSVGEAAAGREFDSALRGAWRQVCRQPLPSSDVLCSCESRTFRDALRRTEGFSKNRGGANQRAVLRQFVIIAERKGSRQVRLSQRQLVERVGMKQQQVCRTLDQLRERGWLRRVPGRQTAEGHTHELHFPADHPAWPVRRGEALSDPMPTPQDEQRRHPGSPTTAVGTTTPGTSEPVRCTGDPRGPGLPASPISLSGSIDPRAPIVPYPAGPSTDNTTSHFLTQAALNRGCWETYLLLPRLGPRLRFGALVPPTVLVPDADGVLRRVPYQGRGLSVAELRRRSGKARSTIRTHLGLLKADNLVWRDRRRGWWALGFDLDQVAAELEITDPTPRLQQQHRLDRIRHYIRLAADPDAQLLVLPEEFVVVHYGTGQVLVEAESHLERQAFTDALEDVSVPNCPDVLDEASPARSGDVTDAEQGARATRTRSVNAPAARKGTGREDEPPPSAISGLWDDPVTLDRPGQARARQQWLTSLARDLSEGGLRVDVELAQQRVAAHEKQARALLQVLDNNFHLASARSDGLPSAQPWTTATGRKQLTSLAERGHWPRHPDGLPRTDQDTLAQMAAQGGELGELAGAVYRLQESHSFERAVITHCRDGRVHPTYGTETVTGRWTSTAPNVFGAGRSTPDLLAQRDLVLAEEGENLLGADLDGIDARAVAGLCGDPAYAELFGPGIDIHAEMAELFFGDRALRQQAKAITHGLNFGRGAASIAEQTRSPAHEVRQCKARYFRAFPRLRQWQQEIRAQARDHGRIDTGTGRRVPVDPGREWTQAPGRAAQAAARDLAALGLLRMEDAGLRKYLRLFLHDEVVLSVPPGDADEIEQRLVATISFSWNSPGGLVIPITASAHSSRGPRWSDLYRP